MAPHTIQKCVFCGGTPVTREHILPFWLREAVGGGGSATHLRLVGDTMGIARADSVAYGEGREAAEADVVVRAVCRVCNNGWLNDLDHDVAPLIIPLIRNENRPISEGDRLTLARWSTKIGLLLEL